MEYTKGSRIVYTKGFLLSLRYKTYSCITLPQSVNVDSLKQLLYEAKFFKTDRTPSHSFIRDSATTFTSPNTTSTSWRNTNNNNNNNIQIKYQPSQNAWTPSFSDNAIMDSDMKLYKDICAIFNKMAPQNFDLLFQDLISKPINTSDNIQRTANIIYQKGVQEPHYRAIYAKLCKKLWDLPRDPQLKSSPLSASAHALVMKIIRNVQECFDKGKNITSQQQLKSQELLDIKHIKDVVERKMKLESYDETIILERLTTLGNIRFIGELYNYELLKDNMIRDALDRLIQMHTLNDELIVEELCQLIICVGPKFSSKPCNNASIQHVFDFLRPLAVRTGVASQISSRIRFMIHDVIELKDNKWNPRLNEVKPKMLSEIEQEMVEEKRQEQLVPTNISKSKNNQYEETIKSLITTLENFENDEDVIIKLFITLTTYKDTSNVVADLINGSFEKGDVCRQNMALSFVDLFEVKRVNKNHLSNGLKEVLRNAQDLLEDYPLLYEYIAIYLAIFLKKHMLTPDTLVELVALTHLSLLTSVLERYSILLNKNCLDIGDQMRLLIGIVSSKLNLNDALIDLLNQSSILMPYTSVLS